jgi:hypothetical protein
MRCPRCADEQSGEQDFCSRCGADLAGVTPVWQGPSPTAQAGPERSSFLHHEVAAAPTGAPPARPARRWPPVAAGIFGAALVAVVAFVAVDRVASRSNGDNNTGVAASDGGSASTVPAPATDAVVETATVPPDTATASSGGGPVVVALQATADADRATVEALVGQCRANDEGGRDRRVAHLVAAECWGGAVEQFRLRVPRR